MSKEMITREFQVRLVENEERTIVGLAVPYGQEIDLTGNLKERFEAGAIETVENVKLFYGHEEPIGKVIEGKDTEEGFEIIARLSDTPRANEVYTLLKDDVLNRFSVGFFPVKDRKEGQTIVRELIDLKEVSVVPWPAFEGAIITQVRSEGEPEEVTPAEDTPKEMESKMSENIELDVRSVQDEVAELRRVIEAGQTVELATPATHKFRSQGEFAKALVTGDEDAKALARAASTSADTVALPGFLGLIDNLIDTNRPALSAFSRAALPAAGLTVEYAKVSANTITVGVQDPENEALAFGNLTIDSVSANVITYGGYTEMSKQTIVRSSVNYLDTALRALSIAYANATNAALISTVQGLSYTGKVFDVSAGTSAALIAGLTDASTYIFKNSGLRPEAIVCGTSAFKFLLSVQGEDGRPVVLVNGAGVNNIGAANVPGLSGQIMGLPIIVDPAMTATKAYVANSAAIQTLESAGAPVRLSSEDITTLTDAISVYGFMAITVPFAAAIVELDVVA
ncbi:Phage major capsid protein, HK97 [uncultured Caudovirales phage]|jgi:HK97 family phage prohead protease/HK97 family phage major capsid protein|uniref:Phage major capsid protein, HK97 n=1 Tax=uncultured Caudovirales phage TaxID=2100421 RepID=A0A6J5MV22_9CAUD|nr:Phage major capsid protein, HK97 [uncultured Caudovirales phage]